MHLEVSSPGCGGRWNCRIVERCTEPKRLPVVLTRDEVKGLLDGMEGATWLVAGLLYGAGLRHCFATHLWEDGDDIRRVRNCWGMRM